MIRVVVTGSECTGKTTLAADLAAAYDVGWVPEYARRFVLEKGAAPVRGDVDAIARGQIEDEDRRLAAAPALLIKDTDLLSTIVYSRHYYGDFPHWIESALLERRGDLYLLTDIDVPWVPDGDQRDRPDRREEMQSLFRNALIERRLPFVEISGSRPRRLAAARDHVDPLLV